MDVPGIGDVEEPPFTRPDLMLHPAEELQNLGPVGRMRQRSHGGVETCAKKRGRGGN